MCSLHAINLDGLVVVPTLWILHTCFLNCVEILNQNFLHHSALTIWIMGSTSWNLQDSQNAHFQSQGEIRSLVINRSAV